LKALFATYRIDLNSRESFHRRIAKEKCLIVLWHNRLLLLPSILKKYASHQTYCAVISKSRDGDPLALLAESYSEGRTLRVAHDARQIAIRQMIQRVNDTNEILIITPDGPRGPKYRLKPGVVVVAQSTKASIIPISWKASSYWEFKTWDQMQLPKPFSRVQVFFGEPVQLVEGIEESSLRVERSLNHFE